MANQPTNVEPIRRRIPFTIDGQPYTTDDLSQRASALLQLAGLDPATFDLGELVGKEHPKTKRFADDEVVEDRQGRAVHLNPPKRTGRLRRMGVDVFIYDMAALGFEATLEAELVVYRVVPVDGAHAGRPIETGVAVAELQSWPQVPPHWLHFPAAIEFSRTNIGKSPTTGLVEPQPSDIRLG